MGRRGISGAVKEYQEEPMKVVVDYDLCEANAVCMQHAPKVFRV